MANFGNFIDKLISDRSQLARYWRKFPRNRLAELNYEANYRVTFAWSRRLTLYDTFSGSNTRTTCITNDTCTTSSWLIWSSLVWNITLYNFVTWIDYKLNSEKYFIIYVWIYTHGFTIQFLAFWKWFIWEIRHGKLYIRIEIQITTLFFYLFFL